jgi:hypothetical protein
MKGLGTIIVCMAVLYGVDAILFHSWYAALATDMINNVYTRW